MKYLPLGACAFSLLVAACGGSDSGTGAVCPTTDPPTYASFGQTFFDTHCTSCHSSARTGSMRAGAPAGRDYDTLDGIRRDLADIDAVAAAGPDATNSEMPLGLPTPTLEMRKVLGEFLACEKAR